MTGVQTCALPIFSWCPPDLQRAFIVELLKLLPKGLDAKIDALERMKEQAATMPSTPQARRHATIPITQMLFQARLEKAATEQNI